MAGMIRAPARPLGQGLVTKPLALRGAGGGAGTNGYARGAATAAADGGEQAPAAGWGAQGAAATVRAAPVSGRDGRDRPRAAPTPAGARRRRRSDCR